MFNVSLELCELKEGGDGEPAMAVDAGVVGQVLVERVLHSQLHQGLENKHLRFTSSIKHNWQKSWFC